jgi:hypothetical protein
MDELTVRLAEALTPAGEIMSQHGTGFIVPSDLREPYPNGFWRSRTVSGRDCGFGFYCWNCHLLYTANAPHTVFHCRRAEIRNDRAPMLTHRLGSHVAYGIEDMAEQEFEPTPHADFLAPRRSLFEWVKGLLKGS